jgi:hypothetical protein
MQEAKIFRKFRRYWIFDLCFRAEIYSSYYVYDFERIGGFGIVNVNNIYTDLDVDINQPWSFLVGLLFPKRQLDESYAMFNSFGRELSLGGRWVHFWKTAERDYEKQGIVPRLDNEENGSFFRGCAFKSFREERFKKEPAYLLGQDWKMKQNRKAIQKMIGIS